MHAAADRLEFAPPPQPGGLRAFVLAIVAHLLLMLALTWGINWNRESENVAAEAELWSNVPQQAAPPVVEAPPPPPMPVPRKPVPAPAVKEVTPPPAPRPREADIAIEREQRKKAQARAQQELLEKEQERKLIARKKQQELLQQELAKKAAQDKKAQAELDQNKTRQADTDKKLALQRQENLRRMQGLAGATGAPSATGAAQRSSGPTDSYGARIRARVRPNIVFSDDVAGNPQAEVEVRMAPDGTITSRKLVKSSGVKSWDDAVLRALDRTEVLPRDIDGRVHTPLTIEFRPKG